MTGSPVDMLRRSTSGLRASLLLLLASSRSCAEIIKSGASSREHVSAASTCEQNEACSSCKNGKDGGDKRVDKTSHRKETAKTEKTNETGGQDGREGRGKGSSRATYCAQPATCHKMAPCVAMPASPKECGECPDSRIDQTFRWTVEKINVIYGWTMGPLLQLVGHTFTWVGSWFNENPLGWALESIGSFLSTEPHAPRICFIQALHYR